MPTTFPLPTDFHELEEVRERIDEVLTRSVADETEIVWFERHRRRAVAPDGALLTETPRLTVLVRIVEGGRVGWYRTDSPRVSDLLSGVRQAIALSRVHPRAKKQPVLPEADDDRPATDGLADENLLNLSPDSALATLRDRIGAEESARLEWSVARLAIANSRGLRRDAAATEATLDVRSGRGLLAGRAAASARSLEDLRPESVVDRARQRRLESSTDRWPETPFPVLLSPEATIELLNVLNTHALAGRAYLEGTSFLTRHRKVQVFDRRLELVDDASSAGLPFPFDLEGSPKHRLELIEGGRPTQLALNLFQGGEAGLRPTAQAVGGEDSLFGNLLLSPGDASEHELLEACDGGLWIGHLEPPECFEPRQLQLRTRARNVARIEGGRRGPALPASVWESSVPRIFARLRAIGGDTVTRAMPSTPLGGITAPSVALEDAEGLGPAGG